MASDRRFKKDIENIGTVLPSLLKLKPSEYYLKSCPDAQYKSIGLIAQDVVEYFPQLVSETNIRNSDEKYYSINYTGFTIIAIKAIQEQNQLIMEQQKEIDALKLSNSALEERLTRIETLLIK